MYQSGISAYSDYGLHDETKYGPLRLRFDQTKKTKVAMKIDNRKNT